MRLFYSNTQTIPALAVAVFLLSSFKHQQKETNSTATRPVNKIDLKMQALKVLQTKCNVCHQKQNPRKVFTTDNMLNHASKIHKQVFVKKRMPKGDDVQLTRIESTTLKQWLSTTNQF